MCRWSNFFRPPARHATVSSALALLLLLVGLFAVLPTTTAMTHDRKLELREEARQMFRHGWDPYMQIAFPEDEIKPVSCIPHHRDRQDARDIGRNDPLGDFSLTAIDTLSSLATMAASDEEDARRFWSTVQEIVRIYWYNAPTECDGNCGNRSSSWGRFQRRPHGTRGFDIDAKVQVFETTIRVLGGLLSAHLFATDQIPSLPPSYRPPFEYKDELLLLAQDLGKRLLPALTMSPTGIPYPRINLRYGLPHGVKNPHYYQTRPLHAPYRFSEEFMEHASERSWRRPQMIRKEKPEEEKTENCIAGAGSLVLEFTTLSRLTGDPAFETAAKHAFEAVWSRRSNIGLLGTGVDAESGLWEGANSGVGAGSDSFFEYAFKAYVLLSGRDREEEQFGEAYFLDVWENARTALERHVLVREPATWWNNVHLATGAGIQGAQWIDSLGAFWPGALSGAGTTGRDGGEDGLELGTRGSLVYAALWARYAALPERYNTRLSAIDSGLSWYPGRPEFIESTYLLYRATKDPYYLHVGEMVMKDLKRRCRTKCGWAGLQDVRSGEQQDRMESFWLGETWTYLFLLFDEDNPLHKLDTAWVFTTEGHPLLLPRTTSSASPAPSLPPRTCAAPPKPTSIFSSLASRPDFFHAAFFTRLLTTHSDNAEPSVLETSDPAEYSLDSPYWSPTNSSFYPWTLPPSLIPPDGVCAPIPSRDSLELLFPEGFGAQEGVPTVVNKFLPKIQRVNEGLKILSLDAMRLSLISETPNNLRINKVAGISVGKSEKVFLGRELMAGVEDVNFRVVWEETFTDLVVSYANEKRGKAMGQQPNRGVRVSELLERLVQGLVVIGEEEPEAQEMMVEARIAMGGQPIDGETFDNVFVLESPLHCDFDDGLVTLPQQTPEVVVVPSSWECSAADIIERIPDRPGIRAVVVSTGDTTSKGGIQRNRWGRERRHKLLLLNVEDGGTVEWTRVEKIALKRRAKVNVGGNEVRGLWIT